MLASVNGQDDDHLTRFTEVHGVREPTDKRAPCVALHAGIGQRILQNRRDRCFDRRREDSAQPGALSLIPGSRIE